MQNEMRDRLVSLINQDNCPSPFLCSLKCKYVHLTHCIGERLADKLIANGLILLPFKVGDTVYYITGIHNKLVKSAIVECMTINCDGICEMCVTSDNRTFWNDANIFYKTREEAEAKLKEMKA